jgi:prepilin-type N-terminal cleavage/methylation domain-containing protein
MDRKRTNRTTATSLAERGFTMIEMLIVITISGIMAVYAVTQITPMVRRARAETAIQTVAGWMRRTQERAVDERRVYRLSFIAPGTLQIDLVNIAPPNPITYTFIQSINLPQDVQFQVVASLPTGVNTPDGFSAGGVVPINLGQENGGGLNQIYFQPDGRSLDSLNRPNSGVVYTCRAGEILSCRAATVWATTGRTKVWRVVQQGASYAWSQ